MFAHRWANTKEVNGLAFPWSVVTVYKPNIECAMSEVFLRDSAHKDAPLRQMVASVKGT